MLEYNAAAAAAAANRRSDLSEIVQKKITARADTLQCNVNIWLNIIIWTQLGGNETFHFKIIFVKPSHMIFRRLKYDFPFLFCASFAKQEKL